MKLPIELVVFDIAGTTVKDDGEIARAFRSAMSSFGYEVAVERINPLMGYKKPEAIRRLIEEHDEGRPVIVDQVTEIHDLFLKLMIHHYQTVPEVIALPDAEFVFAWLKQNNIKVGLDTGFSADIAEVIVHRLGWLEKKLVDYVVCSDQVASGRPAPHMIKEMMNRADIKKGNRVVKVGDTGVDVQEGKNAGCLFSIAVTTGAFQREALLSFKPSFIIDGLIELIPILEGA